MADEDGRLALLIETDADLSAIRGARSEVKGLGTDTVAATQSMVAAEQAQVAATGQLTVSATEMKAALAATNGDLAAAAKLLAAQRSATTASTAALGQHAVAAAEDGAVVRETAAGNEAAMRRMALLQIQAMQEDQRRASAAVANREREAAAAAAAEAATRRLAAAEEQSARSMALAHQAAIQEDAARTAALNTTTKIPPAMRTAANATGILTQAAMSGSGSLAGMAAAAGGAAQGIAMLSSNAKVAASAAGIGALITVGVVLAGVYKKATEEVGATAGQIAHIGRLSESQIPQQLENMRAARDAAVAQAARSATGDIRDIIPTTQAYQDQKRAEELTHAYEALVQKADEFRRTEKLRLVEATAGRGQEITQTERSIALQREQLKVMTDSAVFARGTQGVRTEEVGSGRSEEAAAQRLAALRAAAQAAYKSEAAVRLDTIEAERKNRVAEIEAAYRRYDANAHLMPLTQEETAQRAIQVEQANEEARIRRDMAVQEQRDAAAKARIAVGLASNRPDVAAGARLRQIELERIEEIRKTGDVLTATEAAEIKKRKLYWDTAMATASSLKGIQDLSANSDNARLKAAGQFAKNYRALIIGAKAAEAAVDSARAFASIPAHLAAQDYSGALLAGLAGTQLAAAAALGFAEAGGGGSAGGGGGGSGSAGGGESTTFQPNGPSGGGAQVINLYTVNPYSGEALAVVSYELGRQGALKRPIQLPPTTGLQGAN